VLLPAGAVVDLLTNKVESEDIKGCGNLKVQRDLNVHRAAELLVLGYSFWQTGELVLFFRTIEAHELELVQMKSLVVSSGGLSPKETMRQLLHQDEKRRLSS